MVRRHFSLVLFLSQSALCLAFLSWSARDVVHSLRYVVHYALSPVATPSAAVFADLGDFGRNVRRLIDLDAVFRDLESRGLLARFDRLREQAVAEENRRLTALLDLKPLPRYRPMVARVWSREAAAGLKSLTIRRGAADGVRPADPVVLLQDGREVLLGQVAEVFPRTARVMLATDPSSSISARVTRTGEEGAVEGAGTTDLVLSYLLSDTEVRPGDEVVTAGLGEIFPPGLLIGSVRALESGTGASFRQAIVASAARANRASEVLVLRRSAGETP